nr:sialidase-like isoform X2 [Ipomoea batatas]
MNRSFRNSTIGGGKNFPLPSQHRRGFSLNGASNKESFDDPLDLFSKGRRSISAASSDESDVSVKLGRLSLGSAMVGKNGLEDLFSSSEEGKHDYDWLLTPPGTPLVPSSNGNESQPAQVAPTPRGRPLGRSVSAAKASRLSVSQSENSHPVRPTRSNSVTRQSISSSQYNTYSNKSSNILNTSSSSVSSYIRPSTPTNHSSSSARSSTPMNHSSSSARSSTRSSSSARPSTPTSRPTLSRPSTPSRTQPSLSTASRPSQNSRPSTPSSRPQISAPLSSPAPRSISRPSTPTRRNSMPSISPASSGRSVSNGRTVASRPSSPGRAVASVSRPSSPGRTAGPVSRPSSPGPPVRRTPQPIVPPDFSLETPSNLRTSLPDRPLSAGRSRPGAPASVKGGMEIPNGGNLQRRHSSPIVSRGRLTEPSGRGQVLANGHATDASDSGRASRTSQLPLRKPVRTHTDSAGFGGTISKKSLDMAIRHMDIRNGANGVRPVSGSTLFPHSIRSNGAKSQQNHGYGSSSPASLSGSMNYSNSGCILEKGNYFSRSASEEDRYQRPSARVTDVDIYESSRYDMLLLKEDAKNTSWLHSIDDKSDAMFENGFEQLPEPFDPLL